MRKRQLERTLIAIGKIDVRLYRILSDLATAANVPLNEYCAGLLAQAVGKPELGQIRRKSIGRPRTAEGRVP
jgi:hypothetical protein